MRRPSQIIQLIQAGYCLHDSLLQPALLMSPTAAPMLDAY